MDYYNFISDFFLHVKCNKCNQFFKEDCIEFVRKEDNSLVLRITCSTCGHNLGLVIFGIDKGEYKKSLKFTESSEDREIPVSINTENDPISYDDVIQAHDFFTSLEDDWAKYLPKIEGS